MYQKTKYPYLSLLYAVNMHDCFTSTLLQNKYQRAIIDDLTKEIITKSASVLDNEQCITVHLPQHKPIWAMTSKQITYANWET